MKRIKLPPEQEPTELKTAPGSTRVKLYPDALPMKEHRTVIAFYDQAEVSKIQYRWAMYYAGECERNGPRAAIKAGYKPDQSGLIAWQLKNNPKVMKVVEQIDEQRMAKLRYDGDRAARLHYLRAYHPRFKTFFNAFIPCCRHCHGINYEYQRTHAEFEEDFNIYLRTKKPLPFDEKGGSDFDAHREPNPLCPNCFGKGDYKHPVITFKDLSDLSPEAETLISGVKVKNGQVEEITFHETSPSLQFLQPLQEAWERAQSSANRLDLEKILSGLTIEELDQIIEQANEKSIEYLDDTEYPQP